MKRLGVLALVVASLTASLLLTSPKNAVACYCAPTVHRTPADWAKGTTCSAAQSKLYNKLVTTAGCELCYGQVVYTAACYPSDDGKYKVDGYLNYQCAIGCDPNP